MTPSIPRTSTLHESPFSSNAAARADTHVGLNGRVFDLTDGSLCYQVHPQLADRVLPSAARQALLEEASSTKRVQTSHTVIPAATGRGILVPKHHLFRLSVPEGPQVADVNFFNANDPTEHFFCGKTRQLHSTHLSVGDTLWTTLPYVRPLATLTADSVNYGRDADNAALHDVLGTRCDQYTRAHLINPDGAGDAIAESEGRGKPTPPSCYSNLCDAVRPFGIDTRYVHDVLNIFMLTGIDKHGKYFTKPSPVRKGDYLEMISHMDMLVAVSACPQGDVSTVCGDPSGAKPIPYPLVGEVYKVPESVLEMLE